jgi:hypothetical protein
MHIMSRCHVLFRKWSLESPDRIEVTPREIVDWVLTCTIPISKFRPGFLVEIWADSPGLSKTARARLTGWGVGMSGRSPEESCTADLGLACAQTWTCLQMRCLDLPQGQQWVTLRVESTGRTSEQKHMVQTSRDNRQRAEPMIKECRCGTEHGLNPGGKVRSAGSNPSASSNQFNVFSSFPCLLVQIKRTARRNGLVIHL